jgi:hypothetical protein
LSNFMPLSVANTGVAALQVAACKTMLPVRLYGQPHLASSLLIEAPF